MYLVCFGVSSEGATTGTGCCGKERNVTTPATREQTTGESDFEALFHLSIQLETSVVTELCDFETCMCVYKCIHVRVRCDHT